MQSNMTMKDKIYDCIVVGGGISGISFAHYLKKAGKNVLIIEKNERIGGQIQTEHSTERPDYWVELGSHTCYNSYTNLIQISKEVGAYDQIQPLSKFSYLLYSSQKIKSISSGLSKFSLLVNCFRYFFSSKEGKTTKEYFLPIVGKRNYERLFKYAFRAVICQPADNYPAEIFLKKRDKRDENIPRRFTFKNGLTSFLQKIIENDSIEVNTSCEIINVNKDNDIFLLQSTDGNTIQARSIAIATNPKISASLLNDLEEDLGELLGSIPTFQSESLNVILQKDKLNVKETAGLISLSDEFMSAVSKDLIPDDKLRSFTFHFIKGEKTATEKIDLACQILDVQPSDIVEKQETNHTLPAMRIDHIGMNEKVKNLQENEAIYLLGNYFYGLSLEDCVNRSKIEAERYLNALNTK